MKTSARKRKSTRFKTISFKITARQRRSLENYCRIHNTTPIKVIKQRMDPFLSKFVEMSDRKPVVVNQLDLFGEE
ncbi:MAG: hypothetical protein Q7J34_07480 [Bacteroidales bacterium]|nr:hypothetical protein [Bacteroidales bacterium]